MTEQELRIKVLDLIKDQCGEDEQEITDATRLADELGFDSLDATELIMSIEDEVFADDPNVSFTEDETQRLYNSATFGEAFTVVVEVCRVRGKLT